MEPFTTIPEGISIPFKGYPELLAVHSFDRGRLATFCVLRGSTTMENFQIADEQLSWEEHIYKAGEKDGEVQTCSSEHKCPKCLELRRRVFEKLETVCREIDAGRQMPRTKPELEKIHADRQRVLMNRIQRDGSQAVEKILQYQKQHEWPRHFYIDKCNKTAMCTAAQLCESCTKKRQKPLDAVNWKLYKANKMLGIGEGTNASGSRNTENVCKRMLQRKISDSSGPSLSNTESRPNHSTVPISTFSTTPQKTTKATNSTGPRPTKSFLERIGGKYALQSSSSKGTSVIVQRPSSSEPSEDFPASKNVGHLDTSYNKGVKSDCTYVVSSTSTSTLDTINSTATSVELQANMISETPVTGNSCSRLSDEFLGIENSSKDVDDNHKSNNTDNNKNKNSNSNKDNINDINAENITHTKLTPRDVMISRDEHHEYYYDGDKVKVIAKEKEINSSKSNVGVDIQKHQKEQKLCQFLDPDTSINHQQSPQPLHPPRIAPELQEKADQLEKQQQKPQTHQEEQEEQPKQAHQQHQQKAQKQQISQDTQSQQQPYQQLRQKHPQQQRTSPPPPHRYQRELYKTKSQPSEQMKTYSSTDHEKQQQTMTKKQAKSNDLMQRLHQLKLRRTYWSTHRTKSASKLKKTFFFPRNSFDDANYRFKNFTNGEKTHDRLCDEKGTQLDICDNGVDVFDKQDDEAEDFQKRSMQFNISAAEMSKLNRKRKRKKTLCNETTTGKSTTVSSSNQTYDFSNKNFNPTVVLNDVFQHVGKVKKIKKTARKWNFCQINMNPRVVLTDVSQRSTSEMECVEDQFESPSCLRQFHQSSIKQHLSICLQGCSKEKAETHKTTSKKTMNILLADNFPGSCHSLSNSAPMNKEDTDHVKDDSGSSSLAVLEPSSNISVFKDSACLANEQRSPFPESESQEVEILNPNNSKERVGEKEVEFDVEDCFSIRTESLKVQKISRKEQLKHKQYLRNIMKKVFVL